MSAAPEIINPQNVADISQCWRGVHIDRKGNGKGPLPAELLNGDASSSSDELNAKVRKPYTITKQRERWTETEHQNFLEALKLYGRAWRRIEEYIGTKTAVQIRSHAQKFFSKLEREASNASSDGKLPDIAIPPPRPKRKPNHPYPKKAGSSPPVLEDEIKETSLSSSAGIGAAHLEGFQFGSFNPCMGRGGPAAIGSPVAGGQFFRSQGSVKIFGKTVSVPKTNKAGGFHDCTSYDRFVSEDNADVPKQSYVAEPKQIVGFSPFVKVRNPSVESLPQSPANMDGDGPCSGATQSGGTGELLRRSCGHDFAVVNTEAADCVTSCDRDCKVSHDPDFGKLESGLMAAGMKEGEKVDVHYSHSMNPALQNWMNNFFHYHSGISIPPIPASGAADGPTSNSLSYWHFIQASAVNYAAYTAAMAAAAAAGWKASNPGGTDMVETAIVNTNEFLLPSVPSPWWPYGTFIPPVNFPLTVDTPLAMDAVQQGVDSDIALLPSGETMVKVLRETQSQGGEPETGLKAPAEVTEICNPAAGITDDETKDCTKTNNSAQTGSRFETSCLTEASRFAKVFPNSVSQLDGEVEFMPVKLSTQGSDTEMRTSPNSLQNAYSSSDEFEDQGKKQGEGSSSGSNTPAVRCQSGEWDAPSIIESKKRDCFTLSGDNDGSGAFQTSCQLCVTNRADLPKLRLKHAEKSRKHQPRDSRLGNDSKRLKSCAHEMELRKEVSQEGRKAFQALFTSKLLPQIFTSAEDGDEHVSRPTVSKNESKVYDCIQFRVPRENIIREGDSFNNAANLEMGNEFQGFGGKSEVISKGFTVSSSSGFVPYRRLVCPEPLKLVQPASL